MARLGAGHWRDVRRYYPASRPALLLTGLASLLPVLLLVPVPLLIGRLFDTALPDGDRRELVLIAVAVLGLQLLGSVATNAALVLVLRCSKRGILQLRDDLARKLYSVSTGYLGRREESLFYDHLVQESQRVEWMSSALFGQLLPGTILAVGMTAVLLAINWKLFVLSFAFVPFAVVANRVIGERLRAAVHHQNRMVQAFGHNTQRMLRLMPLTRARDAEQLELDRQHERHEAVRRSALKVEWLRNGYGEVQRSFVAASLTLVMLVGGLAVISDDISLGELFAFYAGIALLRLPLEVAIHAIPDVISGRQSLTRLLEFLEEPDRLPYDGTRVVDPTGRVEVRHISFGYSDRNVLEDVSLTVEPGRVTALVGPNGAGKTTLVNLVLGFYRPQTGELLVDGVPYADIDLRCLRRHTGVVMQEPLIVPGTIRDNLAYGAPDVTPDELVAAATLASADSFIAQLPDGYDTTIGDGGMVLSGGQRQRLAIARALVGSPRLLILDEPTNHLDERSLREVLDNLWSLDHAPAVLLISHDQRAIAGATVVVEIREGRVVAHRDDQGAVRR